MSVNVEQFKASVLSDSGEYSDAMLLRDYQDLTLSYNAEAAGLSRIGIVGYVAVYRPHLVEHLLIEPVKLLFVCGIHTSDRLVEYVMAKLEEKGKSLWCDAGPEGRGWLSENLRRNQPFIETLLLNFKEFVDDE
jgi:hypothetical protein